MAGVTSNCLPSSADREAILAGEEQAGHRALCDVMRNVSDQAGVYRTYYTDSSRTRAVVQGVTIASAVAGAGFVAFDAHNDNIKAAGLLTGVGTLINNGLSLNGRVDILRDGVAALNCYVGIGNTFALAYVTPLDVNEPEASIAASLDLVIADLGNAIVFGREALAERPTAATADARTALTAAIESGTTVYNDLLAARRSFHRIPDALDAAWRDTDTIVAGRLVGIRPDLQALITQAQALATSTRGEGQEPAKTDGAQAGNPPRETALQRLQRRTANINQHIDRARRIDAEHYVESFERLAGCKALAAA